MPAEHRTATRESGFALVIVLWGVTLIALLAVTLARSTGLEMRRFANIRQASALHAQLPTGLSLAVLRLNESPPADRWRVGGQAFVRRYGGYVFTLQVESEAGRFDLNATPPAVLAPILDTLLGAPPAESQATGRLPGVRGMHDRARVSIVELAALPALSQAALLRLAGCMTVHNASGRIDWHLASHETLAALPGMTADGLESLEQNRTMPDFRPAGPVADSLAAAGADIDFSRADDLAYTVHIDVTDQQGGGASADAIIRLQKTGAAPYRILEWREPALALPRPGRATG